MPVELLAFELDASRHSMQNHIYDDCRNMKGKKTALFEAIILLIIALWVVFLFSFLMGYSRYGLDFTDEGFSLVWMSNPFI
jgi:ABC-type uncharacterized transport system permease subunit